MLTFANRQATQEQTKDPPRYGKGQGPIQEEGEIDDSPHIWSMRWLGCNGCWLGLEDRHRVYALHRSLYVVVAEIRKRIGT